MNELLTNLIKYFSFLYNNRGFRFVDSEVSDSFGSDAVLILGNSELALRFTRDRGQLFMDVSQVSVDGKYDWYSIDIVRKLVDDESGWSSFMDESNGEFLSDKIEEVGRFFSNRNYSSSRSKMEKLKKLRSKELFS